MSPGLHDEEVPIDAELVSCLVRDQFPEWSDLPLGRVDSGGTVNAIYRLGAEMAVRLPLASWGTEPLEREFLWAPRLAPNLPLDVPRPLVRGDPGHDYPFPWAIHRWIEGDIAISERIGDAQRAAIDIAGFVRALQGIDPAGAPANTHRGSPLATADRSTRAAIEACKGLVDTVAALDAWERALATPEWDRPAVWTHGDLWYSNVLAADGRITAVLDFGGVGIGDPAIDTLPAWSLFDSTTRPLFRSMLAVDDATWERGKGWALSMAVLALPYYLDTSPMIVGNARRMIEQLLAEPTQRIR
jgi:aminoglycoside phosphotransferase (APT) family kinase protein